MPEPGGLDLLREWQSAMQSMLSSAASLAGRAEVPAQLLKPMDELLARSGGLIDHIEVDLDEDLGKEAFLP